MLKSRTDAAWFDESRRDLGLHRIHLLSNHPRRIAGIEAYGLEVLERIPLGQA